MNTKYLIGVGALLIFGLLAFLVMSDDRDSHDSAHDADAHGELVAKEPVRADGEFTIAASFYPLAYALERIGGDLVVVENIGAGRDPHDFRPSTQDIRALQNSDLVVIQGADFEPWGDDVTEQLKSEQVPVLMATAELDLREGGHEHGYEEHEEGESAEHAEDSHEEESEDHEDEEHHEEHEAGESHDEHDHEHGAYDPHTWLDPVLMSETVEHLAEALVALDPENADVYQTNAASLRADLAELDGEYTDTLGQCELSEVITSHDAFGYVGERYGFEIHTIAGLSTQDLPSAVVMAELRAEAEEGVGAILLEESSVAAYGETLSRETGLQTLNVNPIAFIVPGNEDYLTIARSNLSAFATALKCDG